jgi:hypothetical protein
VLADVPLEVLEQIAPPDAGTIAATARPSKASPTTPTGEVPRTGSGAATAVGAWH